MWHFDVIYELSKDGGDRHALFLSTLECKVDRPKFTITLRHQVNIFN